MFNTSVVQVVSRPEKPSFDELHGQVRLFASTVADIPKVLSITCTARYMYINMLLLP